MQRLLLTALLVAIPVADASAQRKKKKRRQIEPTAANVAYGTHERQVIDFWKAKSEKPTPLVLYIHGGGWQGGDKRGFRGQVKQFLDAGISVAAFNYRYVRQAVGLKIKPPVKAPPAVCHNILDFSARVLAT